MALSSMCAHTSTDMLTDLVQVCRSLEGIVPGLYQLRRW